jgi:hypothetical protein
MTYFEKLHPWCIIQPLPKLQRRIVGRFRRRSDAEAHLQILRRLIPTVTHAIMFDPMPEQEDSSEDTRSLSFRGNLNKNDVAPSSPIISDLGEVNSIPE